MRRQLAGPLPHHAAPLAVHQQQEALQEVEAGGADEALVLVVVVVTVPAELGVVVVEVDAGEENVDGLDGGAIG